MEELRFLTDKVAYSKPRQEQLENWDMKKKSVCDPGEPLGQPGFDDPRPSKAGSFLR